MKVILALTAVAALGVGLSGCVVSQTHLGDDFGSAVRQDALAQVVDPEPGPRSSPPPTDGVRLGVAMTRYQADKPAESGVHASGIGASSGASASAAP